MSKTAKNLVNQTGNQAIANFDLLVATVRERTGQTEPQARRDVAEQIALYRKQNPRPLTAYERILDDVAHGRPRPDNFDASGP
jgi:hypothetical protein